MTEMVRKAERLLAEGKVHERRGFEVEGAGGTYGVIVADDAIRCECAAGESGKKCYHACAVLMILRQDRVIAETELSIYVSPEGTAISANRIAQNWRRLVVVPKDFGLTELERKILIDAAASIGDDVDSMGWSGHDKAAYRRAMNKLQRRR